MYQGPPFPSPDPMYLQNPTDVNTRAGYYNISLVPYGSVDGQTPVHVSNITQVNIDNEYNIPSPFTISVSSAFNSSGDSMIIDVTITCTQNVTIAQPVLQAAIAEDRVHLPNYNGGSGLHHFYTVMRKMVPDANGTPIDTAWTNGQTQTIHLVSPINIFAFNLSQLSVVAFIQSNATKMVYQAGSAAPHLIADDAGISLISSIPPTSCGTSFTPVVTVKNYGPNPLTSCIINYSTDGINLQTQSWTGNLTTNATDIITLPTQFVTNSTNHIFTCYTSSPNGTTDYNNFNNPYSVSFIMAPLSSVTSSIFEGFQSATFPSTDWRIDNPDNDYTWEKVDTVGGFGASTSSSRLQFWFIQAGRVDNLYLPAVNFSIAQQPLQLTFDVAYRPYSTTYHDSLKVEASTDCGLTWNSFYTKGDVALATVPSSSGTIPFIPNSTQWRKDTVDFSTIGSQPDVLIRFKGISRGGDNLYIDNINLNNAVGINDLSSENEISLYPNPTTGKFQISSSTIDIKNIKVMNVIGECVFQSTVNNPKSVIDLSGFEKGIYFVQIIDEKNNVMNKKIVVQ